MKNWDAEVADVHLIHGVGRSPIAIFKSEEEKASTTPSKKSLGTN